MNEYYYGILFLIFIVMLVAASACVGPLKPCGLLPGFSYRVTQSFVPPNGVRFEKGEILVFKRERHCLGSDPCPGAVYVPEHDYWVFGVPGTDREKMLSGYVEDDSREDEHWSNPKNWIAYFERVPESGSGESDR